MSIWQNIETAPRSGPFICAAWMHTPGRWIVGEAARSSDPDKADEIWWAQTYGEYNADHLVAEGFGFLRWQPMPDPPADDPTGNT